jgi:OPA family glycerol-3-phosphate transporter-like MFS transporter/OPA family sugar phosphate sensor protein UhpC-like MFS transporter
MRSVAAVLKAQPDAPPAVFLSPTEVDHRYRYWRRRILFSSLIGYAIFYFVRTNISVALPQMGRDLGYSKADLGGILTIGGVVYGISKFANGFLGDRANPRYFMAMGLFVCAVMNVLFGLSSGLTALATFWLVNNWAQGMGFPPCARNLAYWFVPEERSTSFGVWHTGHMIGAALVSVLTGYLVTRGWRLCFFVPAGIAVAGTLFILNRLRDTPGSLGLPPVEQWKAGQQRGFPVVTSNLPEAAGEGIDAGEPSYRQVVIDCVFKNKFMWLISLANFFVYTMRYAGLHWGPTQLQEMKHVSPQASGWLLFGFEMCGLVSALAGGWITDRYFAGRAGRVCTIAMLLMIAATWGFWTAPASMPVLAAGCFLLMGLMVYVPQMLIAAMAMNLGTQRAAAAAVGLTGIFAYSSTVLSGWGIGKIVDTAGWNGAFQMLIGCAVVTAVLMALTWNVGAHAETTHPLSPVLRGEGGGEGRAASSDISNLKSPIAPHPDPLP